MLEREPNTIEAQASHWAARLDAGPLSAEDQAQFDTWVGSDRRHHGALIRARAAWLDADRLVSLGGASLSQSPDKGLARPKHPTPARNRRVQRAFQLGLAATLATLSIALAALWYIHAPTGETYVSDIGELRRIALSDGSELTLNTDTQAAVRFKEAQREVALKRGEALFKVVHDATRPFIVRANDVRVKAVGTAFSVRVDGARVDVLVTEGVVEVSRDGDPDTQRISANHKTMIASTDSRADIESVDTEGMARQLAWREGMVAFSGEPLSVAVAEINRYSRHRIYVDDSVLAARPVIGIFHANDVEQFANAAATTFGATIVRSDGAIHLRAAPP